MFEDKTQDDNCEQVTKNFSLHHSIPIYFDIKLTTVCFLLGAQLKMEVRV